LEIWSGGTKAEIAYAMDFACLLLSARAYRWREGANDQRKDIAPPHSTLSEPC